MTCIKKIDWLRQLYHEATKWSNGLTGQVKWSEIKAKDPNNGSKMTVKSLEEALPAVLERCLQNNSVPAAYTPEVDYFLAIVGQKVDNGRLSSLVCQRKRVLGLMDCLELFSRLPGEDKDEVVAKVDTLTLNSNVTSLLSCLTEMDIVEGPAEVRGQLEDKKFKLIDWLRHMYLMCQKALNNRAGQMQWRNAQDPNNSKDGNRMKMDELKESLKVLVPALQDDVVPRAYRTEVDVIRRVLCHNEGSFRNDSLSAEEHLRKVALKLEETFGNLEDPQQLVSALEGDKLPWVLSVVSCLKEHLATPQDEEEEEMVPAVPVQESADVIEIIPDILAEEHSEISLSHYSVEENLQQSLEPINEVSESDGTEYLMDLIDVFCKQQVEKKEETEIPALPSPGSVSYSDSPPVSPLSPHRPSVDEPFSDDSGYYSPESDCPLDQDDAEDLEDVKEDVICDIELDDNQLDEIIKDLDFKDLPDLTSYIPENPSRKRRHSNEHFEGPVLKKARP